MLKSQTNKQKKQSNASRAKRARGNHWHRKRKNNLRERERKNKENKRTNESIKLNKLSSHFSFSSNQKDKFKRLPPCRSHTKLFIFTIAEFCLGIILLYIFFPLLSLSLIARWTVLVYCWSFVVAKHLTKPIICYREDRLIIGRWQVPTICFHSFSYCYLAILHTHTHTKQKSFRSLIVIFKQFFNCLVRQSRNTTDHMGNKWFVKLMTCTVKLVDWCDLCLKDEMTEKKCMKEK